jgi:hypothetical protein
MQFKDPLDESKGRVLVLTGGGSIFEVLFLSLGRFPRTDFNIP